MNGIMIALIIVFVLDLIGSFMLSKIEVKREIMMEQRLQEIKEILLSAPQYSPFSEFEVTNHDKTRSNETEKIKSRMC